MFSLEILIFRKYLAFAIKKYKKSKVKKGKGLKQKSAKRKEFFPRKNQKDKPTEKYKINR